MSIPAFWNASWTAALMNHLWQSTAVVGAAWLLARALSKYHARVRYWVWFVASVKFLLPFSLLMAAGEWLQSMLARPAVAPSSASTALQQIAQPFAQGQMFQIGESPVPAHRADWLPIALLAMWACGALIVAARFARGWWLALQAKRAALPLALAADVPVLSAQASIEPGVFGIFRPVLLLPEGILERLPAEQMKAIIAHEMCHVRRHDNLTYAIHMVVESLFWFHPAVWWIGARLIEERERACDEAVVQAGGVAEAYAEGILNVCRFYVESPVACVAGVTGADLKKRIAQIMVGRAAPRLSLGGKMLLGGTALAALALPLTLGVVCAANGHAQAHSGNSSAVVTAALDAAASQPRFDVVSVRPDNSGKTYWRNTADGFSTSGVQVMGLIRGAYGITEEQVIGLPGWARSERFAVEAKLDPDSAVALEKLPPIQRSRRMQLMMQSLLADRFALKFRHGTQNLSIYEMRVANGGYKMRKSSVDAGGTAIYGNGRIEAHAVSMENLANNLSNNVGTMIMDKTGLAGSYDFKLEWAPEGADQSDPRPSIFTAFKEQLGLKLVSAQRPVDVMVIDHVEQPSPN